MGANETALATPNDVSARIARCGAHLPKKSANSGTETGAQLWLHSFDGNTPLSSVASDVNGNVLVARADPNEPSEHEMNEFDASGTLLWAKPFGTLVAVADGSAGNSIYVAGELTSALELGALSLPADSSGKSAYLVKLDAAGRPQYAVALPGADSVRVLSLAVDAQANVVVSGTGLGTIKVDAAGNLLWSKPFYGHVAFDGCGDLLLTGALSGTVDFGGGPLSSQGGTDVFVVKLSPQGNLLFARRFGDSGATQAGQAIAVDTQNDVLVSGVFDGSLDFGAGELTLEKHACSSDAWCNTAGFLLKLDAQGDALYDKSFGPMRELAGLAVGARDHVLVSGKLPGGVRPFEIPLLVKLDAQGNELWRRSEWPLSGIGAGHDVAIDSSDNVLWSVSALPAPGGDEQALLAKLSP